VEWRGRREGREVRKGPRLIAEPGHPNPSIRHWTPTNENVEADPDISFGGPIRCVKARQVNQTCLILCNIIKFKSFNAVLHYQMN
jgi:hypothetical protein